MSRLTAQDLAVPPPRFIHPVMASRPICKED